MRTLSALGAAVAALALSAGATQAANVITLDATAPHPVFAVQFGGNSIAGLGATVEINFASKVGSTWTFDYTLSNVGSSAITNSRISIFGFNVGLADADDGTDFGTGSTSVTSGTNLFPIVAYEGNVNQTNGNDRDICFKAGGNANNCTGGGGTGLWQGNSFTGQFTLNGVTGTSVELRDFFVRYQSVDPSTAGTQDLSDVGFGTVTAVPEPATWAMMIGGFGLAGYGLRRRKVAVAA